MCYAIEKKEVRCTMKIIVCKDYEEVSKVMAEKVVSIVNQKPDCVFCLPAGNSPIGMYKELVKMYQEGKVDFSQMRTFDMDEYAGLKPEDCHSFIYFMHQHFLDYVNIDLKNVRYPDACAEDLDAMCKQYAQDIIDAGGLDIAITGIGDDGHIAFNEPNSYLLPRCHVVKLDEATRKQNESAFKDCLTGVPEYAISTGMEEHMKTRNYFVVCSGKHKAPLLKKLFENDHIDPMYPVSFLRMHPNVEFIIDEQAASELDEEILNYYK